MEQNLINIGLYTFSALIQADAAVIGLLAVFSVYRLQVFDREYELAIDLVRAKTANRSAHFTAFLKPACEAETFGVVRAWAQPHDYRLVQLAAHPQLPKRSFLQSTGPGYIALLTHVALCSWWLPLSASPEWLLGLLSPTTRIAGALWGFVVALGTVALLGYRSLSGESHVDFPNPPQIDEELLNPKYINELAPTKGVPVLYSVRGVQAGLCLSIERNGSGDVGEVSISLIQETAPFKRTGLFNRTCKPSPEVEGDSLATVLSSLRAEINKRRTASE